MSALGLAEFIRLVKRELMESAKGPDAATKLLVIEDIELSIQVGLSVDAKAGFNIQVVQLGAGGKRDDVHTVRLKMQPLLTHQERVEQLQRDPRWSEFVESSVEYTIKSLDSNSKIDEF